MMPPHGKQTETLVAFSVVALIHILLVMGLLAMRPHTLRPLQQSFAKAVDVFIIHLAADPPPEPPPAEAAQAEPMPVTRPLSRKSQEPAAQAGTSPLPDVPPPSHAFTSGGDWGAAERISSPAATAGRHVPSDYADKVKARVVANLQRPAGAMYKAPPGFTGDTKTLQRQCTIPYELTVDREGRMLSYKIESCGDNALDAAAEAALIKAGPFPPPPNQGAEFYVIYGSANFRTQ